MSWLSTVTRRRLLVAGTALVGGVSAGCMLKETQALDGRERAGGAATGIYIHNETDSDQSVSVTATDADGKTWIDVTVPVDAHTNFQINPMSFEYQRTDLRVSLLPVGNDYTVDVAVDGGVSDTLEWNDVKQGLSPLRVIILDKSDLVFTVDIEPKLLRSEDIPHSSGAK